jgi:5-methyltetrahydrofolate--homocysteine methyltransferase
MTVSAEPGAAKITLEALRRIRDELGCNTVLGVSNVSFGLPNRDVLNGIFFANALENGLTAAIMNPYSVEMMKTYYSYRALHGLDDNFADYIAFASKVELGSISTTASTAKTADSGDIGSLKDAVIKGLKEKAREMTVSMLSQTEPLDIVKNHIIPALDTVGKGFENHTIYLPSLLMSAEAAKTAFEPISEALAMSKDASNQRLTVIIATVKGDIHDIGKNILKLLLENYGFAVCDLGKDVPPETIVDTAQRLDAKIICLSALMTTTVPAMEDTIKLARKQTPKVKIIVGGAVLTQEYADRIGADKYAKDAMEAVRYAESIN